jgi:ubiquinone/menaquinone biosynthesis C-methylase UbiE
MVSLNVLFDIVAPLYDHVMSRPDAGRLAEALDLPADGLLLDAGGGTGRVSRLLAPWVKGVVVCDASRRMLAQARPSGLDVVQGHAEGLPFADGTFARVLVVDALHHFRRQREALVELVRVLAPGGRLLVSEPDIAQTGVRMIALAERLALMDSHFLPPAEIAAMLATHGIAPRIARDGVANAWIIADKPGK